MSVPGKDKLSAAMSLISPAPIIFASTSKTPVTMIMTGQIRFTGSECVSAERNENSAIIMTVLFFIFLNLISV
ncbi:hypothetical protein GCM10009414_18780 [Tatumella terrea]